MYVERASRWHSHGKATDSDSGDITATFGNGRVFKGTYFQITATHASTAWIRLGRLGPPPCAQRLALLGPR